MSILVFDYPGDKQTGTWAKVGGTLHASTPLTNIDSARPDKPVIFTANPTRLTLDFGVGTPKRVDRVSFIGCNFDAAAVIKVQMNATDVWTGPPTVNSTLVVPADGEDGHPGNSGVDLTLDGGYAVGGKRYLSLEITSGQSTLLQLGMVRVSARSRQPERQIQHDLKITEWYDESVGRTYGGVQLAYSFTTRNRRVEGYFRGLNAARFATLQSWWRSSSGVNAGPFLLILDPSAPTKNNEPIWVRWGPEAQRVFTTQYTVLREEVFVTFDEVGRGTPPP